MSNAHRNLVEEPRGKRLVGRRAQRQEDDIKLDLWDISSDSMSWMELTRIVSNEGIFCVCDVLPRTDVFSLTVTAQKQETLCSLLCDRLSETRRLVVDSVMENDYSLLKLFPVASYANSNIA